MLPRPARMLIVCFIVVFQTTSAVGGQDLDFRGAEPILQIGTVEHPPEEVFGSIVGAVVHRDRLVILDGQQLSAFDLRGSFLGTTGRSGGGPGEFAAPRSLISTHAGLLVLDGVNLRISRYEIIESVLELTAEERVELPADDFCSMPDGSLYVLGLREGNTIHRFDGAGQRSFGGIGADADLLALRPVLQGTIECFAQPDAVVFAASLMGTVRAYDTDGRVLWEVEIPGFRRMEVRRNPDGSVTYSAPPGGKGHDVVSSMVRWGAGSLLVQIGAIGDGRAYTPREITDLHSYLIDVETGEMQSLGRQLPRVVWADRHYVISAVDSPVPQVSVYRRSGRPPTRGER